MFIVISFMILWFVIPITFVFRTTPVFLINLGKAFLIALPFSVMGWILYILYLYHKKKCTWFVITNERVIKISQTDTPYDFVENTLKDLTNFAVCFNKAKGGNLYLGRYRKLGRVYFDHELEQRYPTYLLLTVKGISYLNASEIKAFYNSSDFLFFYDLTDPEIPAQIIRERTSAKEYIDPKRKKYKAE